MKFITRRSTPLSPIAEEMQAMIQRASDFWAATAFLSKEVIETIVVAGLEAGTRIRILTGTFGHQTRKAVFRRLLSLSKRYNEIDVRVWNCGRHRNLHAKIYLWRFPNGAGAAWVGSVNLTLGGLQTEGEVVFELRQPWRGKELGVVRQAFEIEWIRSTLLDSRFVRSYKESERTAPDMRPIRQRRTGRMRVLGRGRALLVTVGRHFGERSPVAARVEHKLEGNYDNWVRHVVKMVSKLRPGDRCLIVDRVDGTINPGTVVDTKRDGRYWVFAYDLLLSGDGGIQLNRRALDALARAGLPLSYPGPIRTRWLGSELTDKVVAALQTAKRSP